MRICIYLFQKKLFFLFFSDHSDGDRQAVAETRATAFDRALVKAVENLLALSTIYDYLRLAQQSQMPAYRGLRKVHRPDYLVYRHLLRRQQLENPQSGAIPESLEKPGKFLFIHHFHLRQPLFGRHINRLLYLYMFMFPKSTNLGRLDAFK